MESVLKCLIRDSQALGRGYMHIQQAAQVALGLCCRIMLLLINHFNTSMLLILQRLWNRKLVYSRTLRTTYEKRHWQP